MSPPLSRRNNIHDSHLKPVLIAMGVLFLILLPIVFFTTWLCLAQLVRVTFPAPRNKRIGLLIAHPDDEAMFFAPTLVALTQPALKNRVRVLCLCSGISPSSVLSASHTPHLQFEYQALDPHHPTHLSVDV